MMPSWRRFSVDKHGTVHIREVTKPHWHGKAAPSQKGAISAAQAEKPTRRVSPSRAQRLFGQNMTEYNPAPSPSGHPLLSGPPTLTDILIRYRYSPDIHILEIIIAFHRAPEYYILYTLNKVPKRQTSKRRRARDRTDAHPFAISA